MAEEKGGNSKTMVVVLIAVLILAAVFYWLMPQDRYNWYSHAYSEKGVMADQPYSSKLYYDYLRSLRPASAFVDVDSSLEANLSEYISEETIGANYIVNGWFTPLDSASLESTFRFVENGNSFFLFTEIPPSSLIEEIIGAECIVYWPEYYPEYDRNMIEDTFISTNFVHTDLRREEDFSFEHRVRSHGESYEWYHADEDLFCIHNSSATPLAMMDEEVNFFRIAYGKGYFYFHTTPKLLTNYYIVEADGRDYVERVMAHLAPGDIIYDSKRWLRDFTNSPMNSSYGRKDGPLKFVLQQPSLRWGLYVLLAAGALMLLFSFQRKQRIIPVVLPKENSSMEYVDTVTELYLQNNGQGRIFGHLKDQFFLHVRERYRLSTTELGPDFIDALSKAADVGPELIQELLRTQDRGAHLPNVTSELLAEYYQKLEQFYILAK